MSLPIKYTTCYMEYFESSLEFLYEYSWMYRTANTRFIKDHILDEMPNEWIEYFLKISLNDLNTFPLKTLSNLPNSLQIFYNKLIHLTPQNYNDNNDVKDDDGILNNFKNISIKKNHEIIKLSNKIYEYCYNDEIDIFIDIGCGLGYLSQILFEKFQNQINILCIDLNNNNICNAIKRQQKYYPLSINHIYYVKHKITNDSGKFILKEIKKNFSNKFNNIVNKNNIKSLNLCIIGLHTCADLFISIINLYCELKNVKKLICMPCCYHKFELKNLNNNVQNNNNSKSINVTDNSYNNNITIFKQFPISKEFIIACNIFQKKHKNINNNFNNDLKNIMNRPFLRLACQQTSSKWKNMNINDHINHGKEMFLRGIVECLLKDNEYIVKLKNNINFIYNNKDKDMNNINNYYIFSFDDIENNYEIRSKLNDNCKKIDWNDNHRQLFFEIISKYPEGYKLAEGLTCLQTALQEFCENLVLLDRMCYINNLSEKYQIKMNTKLCKIMDDSISPRCFAVFSEKKKNQLDSN